MCGESQAWKISGNAAVLLSVRALKHRFLRQNTTIKAAKNICETAEQLEMYYFPHS